MADSMPVPAISTFSFAANFTRALQHLAPLLVAEQDGFAGRTLDDDAGHRRTRILLDILFQLAKVDFAVGIERGGDGRKNSV